MKQFLEKTEIATPEQPSNLVATDPCPVEPFFEIYSTSPRVVVVERHFIKEVVVVSPPSVTEPTTTTPVAEQVWVSSVEIAILLLRGAVETLKIAATFLLAVVTLFGTKEQSYSPSSGRRSLRKIPNSSGNHNQTTVGNINVTINVGNQNH